MALMKLAKCRGDGVAVILPAENRLADRGAADMQPDHVLIVPGAAERDRARGYEGFDATACFHQKTPQ